MNQFYEGQLERTVLVEHIKPKIRMSKEENVFQLQLFPEKKLHTSIKLRKQIKTYQKVVKSDFFFSKNTDRKNDKPNPFNEAQNILAQSRQELNFFLSEIPATKFTKLNQIN